MRKSAAIMEWEKPWNRGVHRTLSAEKGHLGSGTSRRSFWEEMKL